MPTILADKIKQTQQAFPSQPPGSVVACPLNQTTESPTAKATPVEVETAFQLTQHPTTAPVISKVEEKPKEKKAWIEIILVDAEGKPMPRVKYRITPPSGEPVEGRLNEHGQAGVYQIEPGNCKITFPDLDKDAWE